MAVWQLGVTDEHHWESLNQRERERESAKRSKCCCCRFHSFPLLAIVNLSFSFFLLLNGREKGAASSYATQWNAQILAPSSSVIRITLTDWTQRQTAAEKKCCPLYSCLAVFILFLLKKKFKLMKSELMDWCSAVQILAMIWSKLALFQNGKPEWYWFEERKLSVEIIDLKPKNEQKFSLDQRSSKGHCSLPPSLFQLHQLDTITHTHSFSAIFSLLALLLPPPPPQTFAASFICLFLLPIHSFTNSLTALLPNPVVKCVRVCLV